jgi:integrase
LAIQSLTRRELLRFLGAARKRSERDWLMFLVGFHHGLRISEILGIKREDVRDGYLTVARLKGSERTVQRLVSHAKPLLDEVAALAEWVRRTPPKTRLFQISRQQAWALFQRYGEVAGIPRHKCHPHVLKHSIAMQTIDKAGIQNVRKRLGHKSIASTGSYLVVSDDAAGKAVEKALKS